MQNSKKPLVSFLGEVPRSLVLTIKLLIFKIVRGGIASRFACRHILKSVMLASCNSAGGQFLACHAYCSVVFRSAC